MDLPAGPYPLPGVCMPTWLMRFDRDGACTSPQARAQLLDRLRNGVYSDIVVFAHGWNYEPAEAIEMYADLVGKLEQMCAEHGPARTFTPAFVGVLWPSLWMSFDDGPAIASAVELGGLQGVVAVLADRVVAAGGGAALERMEALLAAPAIDDADAAELARLIAPAFGVAVDEGVAAQGRDTIADDVLAMMRAMEAALPRASLSRDLTDIDDFSRPADATVACDAPSAAQVAGRSIRLDPRHALRLFSLYVMKDRAGAVGATGVARLLADLLEPLRPGGAGPRVHAVGNSFGCKVMLSAVCAQPLPRPLNSLLLLQPAVSHLCFASSVGETGRPGGYRAALAPDRVIRPIVTTYSRRDAALHRAFHLALRRSGDLGEAQIAGTSAATRAGAPPSRYAALGGYGPRGASEVLVDPMPPAGVPIVWPDGDPSIVAFDGSHGAIKFHGDVTGLELAWVLHQLMFRP